MPLTPAHAAAVVPLRHWKPYFWLSPLVVGSMAPDFAYFLFPPHSLRHVGHSLPGLVLFCIPVGLAVLYAFHRFLKRPLVLLLSRTARAKFWPYCGPYSFLPWRRLAWISVLIFAGAVTHVVWDGFTHDDGWAVQAFPQMKSVLFTVGGHQTRVFGVLQLGSSLLGLGLLAWWTWKWFRSAPEGWVPADSDLLRRARPAIAATLIAFGAAVGLACGLRHACNLPGGFDAREFVTAAFLTGVDAFGLALLAFAAAMNWRNNIAADDGPIRQSI